jgi:hypothetical protein
MNAAVKTSDIQPPVNGYILRAVGNIIVPEGMDNVEVTIGQGTVTVTTIPNDDNRTEINVIATNDAD